MWTTLHNSRKMVCITRKKSRIYIQLSTLTNINNENMINVDNKQWLSHIYQQIPSLKLINPL